MYHRIFFSSRVLRLHLAVINSCQQTRVFASLIDMSDEMLYPDTKAYGAERLEITLMSFITDCFNAILETRLHLPLTILPILTK
jgi:hypothetical protein